MQKVQKIDLRLEYMIDEKGRYLYNGEIGPHVDKISTQFGGARTNYEDGDIEEVLSIWHLTSQLHG